MIKYFDNFPSLKKEYFDKLEIYFNLLVEYNEKFNLTSIVSKEEVYIKHFVDSLKITELLNFNDFKTFLDIGTGAGLPGVVIAIFFPNLKVTLIESNSKKCLFLEIISKKLELNNVIIINKRAEEFIKENRNSYDIVTARAVGSLPLLLEIAVPFVKLSHYYIAMRGKTYEDDLKEAENAIKELKIKLVNTKTFDLPENSGSRANMLFIKNKNIDKYPREYKLILNKHL
ncbi:MAG: 16S rRNA (guanine(527)-N(7))-methyltransferase RsmG [Acholeplasmatales bacterium]|jgi:16S rRNA (guanine527-N7)-methyltransferase|nr:16S rRNA (guanine(527)-N(7))-methyltransferase RsmG [Acholeplasmatales bacterium]